jgi:hypothetical protein
MDSYTARPDRTAARLTDARSLAVPVPFGTLVPTALLQPPPFDRRRLGNA